jgi:quercetin dioxygenase-like cupin family protein
MTEPVPSDSVALGPGEGEAVGRSVIKADRPELALFEFEVAPGGGAALHFHKLHSDSFYVLEGELEFRVDGETIRAEAGTSVIVPPGVVHAFTSVGRARFLNVHAPSWGFAEYLQRVDAGEDVDAAAYDNYAV